MAQQTHAAEQLQKRESQRGRGDGDAEAGAAKEGTIGWAGRTGSGWRVTSSLTRTAE